MARGRASGIIGATSWQSLAQLAPLIVNLLLTPFVITTLGREAYGLWIVTSNLVYFIGQIDGGVGRTVMRYYSRFVGQGGETAQRESGRYTRTLTLIVVGISVALLAPPFIFAGSIVDFFHAPAEIRDGMVLFLQVSLAALGISLWRNVLAAILNAHQLYALTSLTQLASYVGYAATITLTLNLGWGMYGMTAAAAVQVLVTTVIIVPAALKRVTLRGVGGMTRPEIKEFFTIAWKLQISGLLAMLSFQGTTLIVGRAAPRDVPDFGPAATFANQLRTVPLNAIRPVQGNLGSIIGAEGSEKGREKFAFLQRVWVIGVTGWVVVGAPAALYGVNTWLPLEGQAAGQIAALLLIAHLFALLPQVLFQWQMLESRPEVEAWSSTIATAITIGLSLMLAGPMGGMGVTIALLTGQSIALVFTCVTSARQGLLPRNPLRDIPALAALVCGAATLGATHIVTSWLSTVGVGGAAGLLLIGATAGPFLAIYLLWTLGPRRIRQFIAARRSGR